MGKCLLFPLNRINYGISIARRCCHDVSRPVEQLNDRVVVRATGQDVLSYLQGLATADIYELKTKPVVYSMFLNSKGRVLFDAFVHKNANVEGVLIECHRDVSKQMLSHLNLFKVRRKIDLKVENEMKVLVGRLNDEGGVDDPRTSLLGQRMVSSMEAPLTSNTYHMKRFSLGIAEGPGEIPTANCFPLEYNLQWLNGVSFDKGCYIGQELTARTHHTGVIRKRIMPLLAQQNSEITYGDSVVDVESGKAVGNVRGVLDNRILALMRVKEALSSKSLQVRNVNVDVVVPEWWPKEFYK